MSFLLRDFTEAYLSASKEDKIRFINAVLPELIESPIFESNEFKNAVDTAIVLSDNEILPRLRSVEKVTGNYSFAEFEEHDPTLPEQITEIKTEIETIKNSHISQDDIKDEIPVHKDTTAEKKVYLLLEKLKEMSDTWSGKKSLDPGELKEFVRSLPEKLRGKDTNERRLISRILKKAEQMYPNKVEIHKNEGSRHEASIFLKSYQSKGMVRTPLFLAGELL
jgi:hypothetical protein